MMSTANTGAMVDVLSVIVGRVILPESWISVSDEVHKRYREGASSHWLAFDVAQPPLLVLLSVHHDHLALGEGQLIGVVGYTVVHGFHSLWPLL